MEEAMSAVQYDEMRERLSRVEEQLCVQNRLLEEVIAQVRKTNHSANFTVDAVNGLYAVLDHIKNQR